jgi:hypothetical protein
MGTADRVQERRRAAALARHYRDEENLPIAEIARRLGRAPATVKAYLYDPTGERARAVKRRYQGVCRGCGAPTAARGGKGHAYQYCKGCHPGAIAPTRTREWVRDAMRAWRARYGSPPSSTDWSRTHARQRGGEALRRVRDGDWPAPSTVIDLFWDLGGRARRRLPRRMSGSGGGLRRSGPVPVRQGCESTSPATTIRPTATTAAMTVGRTWPWPTPRSCSNASAPSAAICNSCAS